MAKTGEKKYDALAKAIKDLDVTQNTKERIAQHSASALVEAGAPNFDQNEFFADAEVSGGVYDPGRVHE